MTEEATTPSTSDLTVHRECLACGYDLHGLDDDTRCPECGLLNIPQGYRQQVWDLVDSGTWFFSGFLHPFKKRLPGWWWALDRDSDLRRSYKFAARNFIIASLIVLVSCYFANACVVERYDRLLVIDKFDPTQTWQEVGMIVYTYGTAKLRFEENNQIDYALRQTMSVINVRWRRSIHLSYIPSWHALAYALVFISWLILLWGIPTFVGLLTQLRKGLPEYARPQRTVLAACMYESHRLVYVACLITGFLAFETVARYSTLSTFLFSSTLLCNVYLWSLVVSLVAIGAIGWIGPLRSDYTKQLVRSRLHAARIIMMYALVLPVALLLTCAVFMNTNPFFYLWHKIVWG